jgi:hypothetical protein
MHGKQALAATGKIKLAGFFFLSILLVASCSKDDPEPPVEVSFDTDAQSVLEGNEINITLHLERPAISAGTITVQLGGTAVYTEDYNTNPSGNTGRFDVAIAEGATTAQFTVATVNNNVFEDDYTITFTLADPSENFALGSRKLLTLTIQEDESQAIANFQTTAASVAENGVVGITVQIPFSLPTKGPGTITISWASNNAAYNTHFTTLPAVVADVITLSVPDNATGTSLTIIPKDDAFFHDNYVIVFDITNTTGSVKAGAAKKLTVTIQEDENPSFASFSVTDGIIAETNTAGVIVPIALSIPASETGTITVSFTSATAVYNNHFTTLPAASGNNIVLSVAKDATGAELKILPIDDGVDNDNRIIFFTISSGGGVVRPGGNINYVLTITDNEPTLKQVLISFGSASAPLITGADKWNHAYTNIADAGVTWSNLIEADGTATPFDLTIISPLTPQPLGATTGINSGVFPDNAMKEYWYVPGPAQGISRGFSILQLNNAVQYTIRIQGGTTFASADGKNTMKVAVNGDQKSIDDITNNVTQALQWTTISPVASIFNIVLTDTDGGGFCPINAMEISWYED